ncbi:hypothetical protein ACFX2J_016501 [Malus domestica]
MIECMQWEKIDARNGLIGRGLVKTILAILAGPEVNMSLRDRHKAANSVVMLSVSKSDKPIQVYCRLMPSAATTMEVKKQRMDEQFLNAAFVTCGELGRVYEKHSGTKLEQLRPSTPMPLCKKQRQ